MASAIKHEGQITTTSSLIVLLAIWLMISPFVLGLQHNMAALSNDIIFAALIGVLAPYRFIFPDRCVWVSWMNVVLAAWVIISPWMLSFHRNHAATANNIAVGSVVILLAIWSLAASGAFTQRTDME